MNVDAASTRRLRSPDQIKAVAIFGVVFIHAAYLLNTTSTVVSTAMNLFRFDVPCFIMIWAFFFERSYARRGAEERREYTVERFWPLLKDFAVWSLIYFFVTVDWSQMTPLKVVTMHFSGYGWSGQYFFIVLFQLLFLHFLIRKIYSIPALRYAAVALLALVVLAFGYGYDQLPVLVQKLGERPFVLWVPFVFAGIALARNELPPVPRWSWLAVCLIPLEFYLLARYGMSHTMHITPAVVLSSILLFASVVQHDGWFELPAAEGVVSYLGGNTLIVFLANPLIILLLAPVVQPMMTGVQNPVLLLLILVVLTCGIIGICLLLGHFKELTKSAVLKPARN